MNDSRIIRDRQRIAQKSLDQQRGMPPEASAALLAQTSTVSSYPTTASAFFACIPIDIDGSETEGSSVTYVPQDSTVFFAWNAGSQVPPLGTIIVCHAVGGRWVFRYDV